MISDLVLNGQLLIAVPLALVAGLVSFLSPCVLPLVPGYLGYIGGFTEGASSRPHRRRLLRGVALFVLGFTLVFVVVNLLAGATGGWLVHYAAPITRVSGAVLIAMGLVFIGRFPIVPRVVKPRSTPPARPPPPPPRVSGGRCGGGGGCFSGVVPKGGGGGGRRVGPPLRDSRVHRCSG